MNTSVFLIIVLASGAIAGLIHGTVNFAIVEPYLDQAIGIENQNLFATGEEEDTPQFWVEYEGYRIWQKSGLILAGIILGTSIGALFGLVFAFARKSLPGNNDLKKSLILAGIMWFTIYLIPFLKYPANPPTVGDTETIELRIILYLSFIAISGISTIGFYKLSTKLQNRKKFISLIGYGIFISIAFFVMPENPDEVTTPMDFVNEFRFMSVLGVTSFWISIGIIFGLFWNRFKPHQQKNTSFN